MAKFLICILLILIVQEEPVKVWNANYNLQWIDFNGKPDIKVDAVATTASGITFGFSIKEQNGRIVDFTTNIKAHFYPEQSWYKKKQATDHVLAHERLHFDITELHARKFRQWVQKLRPSKNIKEELQAIHESIQKELSSMQNLYDAETDFSRNPENQLKWQNFIAVELNKSDEFKNVVENQ